MKDTLIESVIVDSGTSLILMPEVEFKKLMQLIEYKAEIPYSIKNDFGLESFPCFKDTTYQLMPDLSFNIDGVVYTIPPASYIGYHAGICTLKIMTNKSDKNFVTLGLNFFENYYTVFDVQNKRIGLQTSITSKNRLDLDDSWQVSSLSSMLLQLGEALSEFSTAMKQNIQQTWSKDAEEEGAGTTTAQQQEAAQSLFDKEEDFNISNELVEMAAELEIQEQEMTTELIKEGLTPEQAEEVRREFMFTTLLTVTVLLAITCLLVCQWMQSQRNYSADKSVGQQESMQQQQLTQYTQSLLV